MPFCLQSFDLERAVSRLPKLRPSATDSQQHHENHNVSESNDVRQEFTKWRFFKHRRSSRFRPLGSLPIGSCYADAVLAYKFAPIVVDDGVTRFCPLEKASFLVDLN